MKQEKEIINSNGLRVPHQGVVEFNGRNPFRKDSRRWRRFEKAKTQPQPRTVAALAALPEMKPGTLGRWWLRGLITINKVGLDK